MYNTRIYAVADLRRRPKGTVVPPEERNSFQEGDRMAFRRCQNHCHEDPLLDTCTSYGLSKKLINPIITAGILKVA